jgi:hypothetical protein
MTHLNSLDFRSWSLRFKIFICRYLDSSTTVKIGTQPANIRLVISMEFESQWIDYLLFYVTLKNISLIWSRHHCRWRSAKFRPMPGAQGLWAGRDLYRKIKLFKCLSFKGNHSNFNGTIKIPPCSKSFSAEYRPEFCSPSPVMATSPYKWKILEWDVKQ